MASRRDRPSMDFHRNLLQELGINLVAYIEPTIQSHMWNLLLNAKSRRIQYSLQPGYSPNDDYLSLDENNNENNRDMASERNRRSTVRSNALTALQDIILPHLIHYLNTDELIELNDIFQRARAIRDSRGVAPVAMPSSATPLVATQSAVVPSYFPNNKFENKSLPGPSPMRGGGKLSKRLRKNAHSKHVRKSKSRKCKKSKRNTK